MRIYHGDLDRSIWIADAKYTADRQMKKIYVGQYAKNYKFISEPGLGHWMSVGVLN